MSVPLEIAVEIGRLQEILVLSKGSLVVLDKLAGDQADVFVNGKFPFLSSRSFRHFWSSLSCFWVKFIKSLLFTLIFSEILSCKTV